jgi:hypothetical protein
MGANKVSRDEREEYLPLETIFDDTNTLVHVLDRGLHGKENRLVVRSFYKDMAKDILKCIRNETTHRVYLTGTPGIGKSAFRNYLAWKILQKFKIVKEAVRIAMHKGGEDFFYLLCLDANGSHRVEKWKTFDIEVATFGFKLGTQFFGLSDVSKGNDEHCECFTGGSIIFSSPNETTWQQGGKANCQFFYMPLWEKEELCRFDTPTGRFKKRFDKYGGVARIVWGDHNDVRGHRNRLDQKLAIFNDLRADVEEKSLWSKSHRFVYLIVEKHGGKYSFKKEPKLAIQTRYMAKLIAKKYVEKLLQSQDNDFNLLHASVHGIVFEQVVLRLITRFSCACDFHIFRSTTGCQFPMFEGNFLILPEALETVSVNPQNFMQVITKNISSDHILALPNSDDFPGFDAAISCQLDDDWYLVLLQVTTADEHPLSNIGLKLLEKVHETGVFKKIIIVYVLPSRNKLASFGLQQLKNKSEANNTVFDETSQVTLSISIKKKADEDAHPVVVGGEELNVQKKRKNKKGKKTHKQKKAKK